MPACRRHIAFCRDVTPVRAYATLVTNHNLDTLYARRQIFGLLITHQIKISSSLLELPLSNALGGNRGQCLTFKVTLTFTSAILLEVITCVPFIARKLKFDMLLTQT